MKNNTDIMMATTSTALFILLAIHLAATKSMQEILTNEAISEANKKQSDVSNSSTFIRPNVVSTHMTITKSENISSDTTITTESENISSDTTITTETENSSSDTAITTESENISSDTTITTESENISSDTTITTESETISSDTTITTESENVQSGTTITTESENISSDTTITTESENISSDTTITTESENVSSGTTITTESENILSDTTITTESENISSDTTITTESDNISGDTTITTESDNLSSGTTITTESENVSSGTTITTESENISTGTTTMTENISSDTTTMTEPENSSAGTTITTESGNISSGTTITTESENISSGTTISTESESILTGITITAGLENISTGSTIATESENISNGTTITTESDNVSTASTITVPESTPTTYYSAITSTTGGFEGNTISATNTESNKISSFEFQQTDSITAVSEEISNFSTITEPEIASTISTITKTDSISTTSEKTKEGTSTLLTGIGSENPSIGPPTTKSHGTVISPLEPDTSMATTMTTGPDNNHEHSVSNIVFETSPTGGPANFRITPTANEKEINFISSTTDDVPPTSPFSMTTEIGVTPPVLTTNDMDITVYTSTTPNPHSSFTESSLALDSSTTQLTNKLVSSMEVKETASAHRTISTASTREPVISFGTPRSTMSLFSKGSPLISLVSKPVTPSGTRKASVSSSTTGIRYSITTSASFKNIVGNNKSANVLPDISAFITLSIFQWYVKCVLLLSVTHFE